MREISPQVATPARPKSYKNLSENPKSRFSQKGQLPVRLSQLATKLAILHQSKKSSPYDNDMIRSDYLSWLQIQYSRLNYSEIWFPLEFSIFYTGLWEN